MAEVEDTSSGVRRRELVEQGEDVFLSSTISGRFLDEFDVEQGFLQARRRSRPAPRAVGIVA
jgi:hypothetical protein